jgi:hypothetical protein
MKYFYYKITGEGPNRKALLNRILPESFPDFLKNESLNNGRGPIWFCWPMLKATVGANPYLHDRYILKYIGKGMENHF